MANNCTFDVHSHYVKSALYLFCCGMLGPLNNDKLETKKSRIVYISRQFVALLIAAVGQISFLLFLGLREQVKCDLPRMAALLQIPL